MSLNVAAEFLVEPVTEGNLGAHVEVALGAIRDAGLPIEIGPFGSMTEGEATVVLSALTTAVQAAFAQGSTRVTLTISPAVE